MNEKTEHEFNAYEALESLACGDSYLRRNFIGASDAPIIMGVAPWRTPYQLWQEKCGIIGPQVDTERMKNGRTLEDEARNSFIQITGIEMSPKRLFSKRYEWMMASLDGLSPEGNYALEIKCPGKQVDQVPDIYIPQLQHQMLVSDLEHIWFFSYVPGCPSYIKLVKRDDEYIEKLIEKEIQFWDCVQSMQEPDLTDRDYRQRDDLMWTNLAICWAECQEKKRKILEEEEFLKNNLIEISRNENCCGAGVYLKKIHRKGVIDYSKIEELKEIDLEKFRKKGSEYVKISTREENE